MKSGPKRRRNFSSRMRKGILLIYA